MTTEDKDISTDTDYVSSIDELNEVKMMELFKDTSDNIVVNEHEEYENAIKLYFNIKNKYEKLYNKLMNKILNDDGFTKKEKRTKIKSIVVPCVYCKRKVNTIFKQENRKYVAYCGDLKKPCKLDIQITKPNVVNYKDEYVNIKESQENLNEQLTILKLKYLFNHIDDTQLDEQFHEITKEKQELGDLYKTLSEEIERLHNSIERNDKRKKLNYIIDLQLQKINTLHTELNNIVKTSDDKSSYNEIIRQIVDIHNDNIYKFNEKLRYINNDIVETNDFYTTNGNGKGITLNKQQYSFENNHIFLEPYEIDSFVSK